MSLTGAGVSRAADYPVLPGSLPRVALERERYRVDFARGPGDLDEILRVRFEVFNLELGEGLASSYLTGRDQDEYDLNCHHLRVTDTATGRVVGTYRLQTSAMAARHRGFYASDEFDLSPLPEPMIERAVEVGRACVTREHRNGQALFMLWKGLAAYMTKNDKRFLFGCCSLNTRDERAGQAAYERLAGEGLLHDKLRVEPRPAHACGAGGSGPAVAAPELPALFRTYLRFGGKICGPPAVDRAFGTIDFFVVFDVRAMDPRAYRLFFDAETPAS